MNDAIYLALTNTPPTIPRRSDTTSSDSHLVVSNIRKSNAQLLSQYAHNMPVSPSAMPLYSFIMLPAVIPNHALAASSSSETVTTL